MEIAIEGCTAGAMWFGNSKVCGIIDVHRMG